MKPWWLSIFHTNPPGRYFFWGGLSPFTFHVPKYLISGLSWARCATMKPSWVPRSPWSQALPTPHQRYVPRWGVYKETKCSRPWEKIPTNRSWWVHKKKHRGALVFVEENDINSAPFHLLSRKLPEFSKKVDLKPTEKPTWKILFQNWNIIDWTLEEVTNKPPRVSCIASNFSMPGCRQRCEACDLIPTGTVPKGCPSSYLTNLLNNGFYHLQNPQKPLGEEEFQDVLS